MCPKSEHPHQLRLPLNDETPPSSLSEIGSQLSDGPIGEHSRSESDAPKTVSANTAMKAAGVSLVRRHQGLAIISTGFLTRFTDRPATFIALREDHGAGEVMVTLSIKLPLDQWKRLEGALITPGTNGSVVVKFDPTTPNEAPPTTSAST